MLKCHEVRSVSDTLFNKKVTKIISQHIESNVAHHVQFSLQSDIIQDDDVVLEMVSTINACPLHCAVSGSE